MNDVPGLFANAENTSFMQTNKRDLRVFLEKQFPNAFKNPIDNSSSTQIQDGMQDILLQALGSTLTFRDYFDLFWMVKVKLNFHISDTIVIDFDHQVRSHHSAKDLLRYHQHKKATKQMEAISVTDDGMTLGKDWPWASFLANHQNKANLVAYYPKSCFILITYWT